MPCCWLYLASKNSPERFCDKPGHPYCAEHQREKLMRWYRPIKTGTKSLQFTGPFARSRMKSRSSARCAPVARFIPIARLIAIAFTAKFATRMTL